MRTKFYQNAREKGKNSLLDFTITFVISLAFYFITSIPLLIYTVINGLSQEELMGYTGPIGFALMLFVFAGFIIGIFVGTKYVHKRPILSVLTGGGKFRWKRMWIGMGLWLSVLILMEVVGYLSDPSVYTLQFDPIPFFMCLLVGLLILPIQTSAEELMLRGYLLQQFGLISKFRWIPIFATSMLFGLLHFGNPEVAEYGLFKSMSLYIGMGLFFGIITIMDDGLEIPLGVHYINNLFAFLFVGYEDSVMAGTPALFMKASDDLTYISVISNLAVMALILILFRRVFKWPSFNYLFGQIRTNTHINSERYD